MGTILSEGHSKTKGTTSAKEEGIKIAGASSVRIVGASAREVYRDEITRDSRQVKKLGIRFCFSKGGPGPPRSQS